MLRRLHSLTIAVLLLGVAPLAVHAQSGPEPGVTIDPNSPAGKEYALPVPSARQEAQGKRKTASKDAPLFGEGVHSSRPKRSRAPAPKSAPRARTTSSSAPPNAPPPTTSSTAAAPATSSTASAASGSGRSERKAKHKRKKGRSARQSRTATTASAVHDSASSPPSPADVAKLAADANDPSSGGGLGSSIVVGGLALAVLLVGGLTGLVLRRRARAD
jgi:hypothetical protein